jgi:NADPH:quinone reductase-like Zn-dependent oxidoreductase
MVMPKRWLFRDNTGLTLEQVATLPMALVAGVHSVKVVGEEGPGDFVLVHAGASGTRSTNIQISRALGARVAATVCISEKADFMRELGAGLVITLDDDDFVQGVCGWSGGAGVSAVINNLGGNVLARSLNCLAPLGRLVSMALSGAGGHHPDPALLLRAKADLRRAHGRRRRPGMGRGAGAPGQDPIQPRPRVPLVGRSRGARALGGWRGVGQHRFPTLGSMKCRIS